MKQRIIRRLHQIQMQILKADEPELNKIGVELLEIEKKLMLYTPEQKQSVEDFGCTSLDEAAEKILADLVMDKQVEKVS